MKKQPASIYLPEAPRRYTHEIKTVFETLLVSEARVRFFQSEAFGLLVRLKPQITVHDYTARSFEMKFGCTELGLRRSLTKALLPEVRAQVYQFHRDSLMWPDASVTMPLSWFVVVDPRISTDIKFTIELPLVVRSDQFKLKHWVHHGVRKAKLLFTPAGVTNPLRRDQIAAESQFPVETKRAEMLEVLFNMVEEKAEERRFTIADREVLRRLNQECASSGTSSTPRSRGSLTGSPSRARTRWSGSPRCRSSCDWTPARQSS